MSLRLRQAIPGAPNVGSSSCLDVISTAGKALIVYASGSNIVLVSSELELLHTLQFWSALPYRAASTSTAQVEGVLCNSRDGLILAWSGPHVVLWTYRSSRQTTGWVVHSSLLASADVTCIDTNNGSLILGTRDGLEYWQTDLAADVTVWDRMWDRKYPAPTQVCVSPLTGHIAWTTGSKSVWIMDVKRKGEIAGVPQELRHPKDVERILWRRPSASSGDAHLYTITQKSVLRIYSPVLDDPTWFQLQATLDSRNFAPTKKGQSAHSGRGSLFVMNADVLRSCIADAHTQTEAQKLAGPVRKAFDALSNEEADVVAYLMDDGSLSFRSVVNMDRKPPTLLRSLPLCRTRLPANSHLPLSSSAKLLHLPETSSLLILNPPSGDWTRIDGYRLSLLDALTSSLTALSPFLDSGPLNNTALSLNQPLKHFCRTPNGRGLLALSDREMTVWYKEKLGKTPSRSRPVPALTPKGQWRTDEGLRDAAIYAKGRGILCYYHGEEETPRITLQHLDERHDRPSSPTVLPEFALQAGDELEVLQGFSDIDDGQSPAGRTTDRAVAVAASKRGETWVWEIRSTRAAGPPTIQLFSHYRLPTNGALRHILPVDPMGWHQSTIDWQNDTVLQDMLLTITETGILEFWSPRLGQHLTSSVGQKHAAHGTEPWYRTGEIRTGRTNISIARCSSRKKTVLVSPLADGTAEMTIWDSKTSEFSIGLEVTQVFEANDVIQDLDWTTTSDLQSILAVGFPHRVELVCEQRLSDSETNPGWASFITIDLQRYTPIPISDSIWLAGGSLAVGTENQIYLFSRFLDRDSPVPSPRASAKNVAINEEPEDIFQLLAQQNGPLWDYHPTVLAQCLVWNKLDLVRTILIRLLDAFETARLEEDKRIKWTRLDPVDFTVKPKPALAVQEDGNRYDSLFTSKPVADDDDEDKYAVGHVARLVEFLDGPIHIPLSRAEKSSIATICQAVLEVERQRRSLDTCGLRYLLSVRMLANQNRLASGNSSNTPAGSAAKKENRLSFRNIVWASHSESQDVLLAAAIDSCEDARMTWDDAKRLGVFMWLKSSETVKSQLETIARNRFMADEARDPTSCSLIFFALGKKKVVHGLWRQAPGHKEQQLMLRFLANDFDLERWKTAAMKNAYALLSKQRYEYAAAFFLLANSPRDAINVIIRQLDDWQLAIAIARVVEERSDGPLMQWILTDTVLPKAFAGGHRWMATWAFWQLGRRDLAVRIIISPMTEIARVWRSTADLSVGDPENDDPSLLLLFQHLKSRSLQTAKGTSEIPDKLEFDFVLHNAKMFFRMGCHPLALDLLRTWSFERPFFPVRQSKATKTSKSSTAGFFDGGAPEPPPLSPPVSRRRPSFMLSSGRRETMIMDMDPMAEQSEPVTRVPSPEPVTDGLKLHVNGTSATPVDAQSVRSEEPKEEPKKVGNLMKELKQDVQQGGMEFDMDNFF